MPEATGPVPTAPAAGRFAERPALRLAAFAGGLALALVAGFGVGRAVGAPESAAREPAGAAHGHAAEPTAHDDSDGHEHGGEPAAAPAAEGVGGLAVSAQGHRLVVERTALTAGRPESLKLRVHGPDGMPVTAFDVVHDKPMHLIVVRRDMTGYQHLHPEMSADGTWSVPVTLPQPGAWRAYADFTVRGPGDRRTALTLGLDLTAAGDYRPRALPAPATSATVAGYTVEYEGTARVGAAQPLLFRVKKGGAAAAVEPYLGAYGHLVVLREGDLGYVHVHPEERLAGAAVKFWLAAPGPGRYRMFFDFRVAGVVHTAEFSLAVP